MSEIETPIDEPVEEKPKTKRAPRKTSTEPKVPRARKPKAVKLTPADWRREQCNACPFACKNMVKSFEPEGTVDILIIAESYVRPMEHLFDNKNVTVKQISLVECLEYGEEVSKTELDTASYCCMGRKLTVIDALKPKLVLSVGFRCYQQLERALGNETKGVCDFVMQPSQYNGSIFWHYCVPEKGAMPATLEHLSEILEALKRQPEVQEGNDDGIEFIVTTDEIDDAFDWLESQEYVALDIETTGLSPFQPNDEGIDPLILSVSIGTDEKAYTFPLFHPQTPIDFDAFKVLDRIVELAKKAQVICHNSVFELDWIASLFPGFEHSGVFHDTMAQAFLLLHPKVSKSLDACIRRTFGFGLKVISGVDVKRLYHAPLESVLAYNARDTKYTYKLFFKQLEQLIEEGLLDRYMDEITKPPAATAMRRRGLEVDEDVVQEKAIYIQGEFEKAEDVLMSLPVIQKYVAEKGGFNFNSSPQIRDLMHNFCGVSTAQKSFDEKVLSQMKHPVAKAIIAMRKLQKLDSTYISPLNRLDPEGGDGICPDNKIHASINTLKVVTTRLSSDSPCIFNFPKRDGKKHYRNMIKAPPGCVMASYDLAQIDYRNLASISGDRVMIKALWEDQDIHTFWATRLGELMPGVFFKENNSLACSAEDKTFKGKCPCAKCELADFREKIKGAWTFKLCYGGGVSGAVEGLGLKNKYFNDIKRIIDNEFWAKHGDVKAWHESLQSQINSRGYITNPFGLKFRAPIGWNDMINYPIQSTTAELTNRAMVTLAKYAYELGVEDLIPILNIYDDLEFYIREELFEELHEIIVETLLHVKSYNDVFLKVPLGVEAAVGDHWGNLTKIGKYSSATWNYKL